jgi:hypothetical protein
VSVVEQDQPAVPGGSHQAEELRRFRSEAEEVLQLKKK